MQMPIRARILTVIAFALLVSAGCGGNRGGSIDSDSTVGDVAGRSSGGFGLPIPGGRSRNPAPEGIGVNAFLWSATLDTIEVMPIEDADPYSGLITTQWYSNPEAPSERFKLTVRILDTRLRADGLNATLHRQVYIEPQGWVDGAVDPASAIQIENAILTRAQQLRIATLE